VLQTYDRDHFTWREIARAKLDGRSRVRFSLPDALDRVRVVVLGTKAGPTACHAPSGCATQRRIDV
jgi:hypothetical protein